MSKETDPETDFEAADDRLFNGKPLEELDEDAVVTVEAEPEDGFEQPVEEQPAQEQQQQVEVQPAAENEHADIQELPPAARNAIIAIRKDLSGKLKGANGDLEASKAENQTLRDELNQLKGQMQAQPAPQPSQQQAPQIPNPATDPEGYHAFMRSLQASAMQNAQLNMSEMMVRESMGDEAVNEAFSALNQHSQRDLLLSQFRQTPHPWGQMMRWHKEQKLVSEIGTDPEAYKQKLKEELLAEMRQTPAQQAPSSPQTPNLPPRVANTPGVMPGGAAQHTMDDAEANLWGR